MTSIGDIIYHQELVTFNQKVKKLVKKYPNDQELGGEIRKYYLKEIKENE